MLNATFFQSETPQRNIDVEESVNSSMSENNSNNNNSNNNSNHNGGGKKDINYYKKEIQKEKAGKRKLYHSLIKLAEELKRLRRRTDELQENDQYRNQTWYEGGLWRAPQVLPEVHREVSDNQRARPREAISLSDMFLNLVIVTGFTRVGLAITSTGQVQVESILYFAVFWTIWGKEASYSTRFDTTDLSAQFETLLTCFAVLFASLSVSLPMDSEGGARIMIMAGFCSFLHVLLMGRVLWWYMDAQISTVEHHVKHYALYNTLMNAVETATWILGRLYVPPDWRWVIFLVAVLMALRIPRAFLANDFHGTNLLTRSNVLTCLAAHTYSVAFRCSSRKFAERCPFHSSVGIHAPECRCRCHRLFRIRYTRLATILLYWRDMFIAVLHQTLVL